MSRHKWYIYITLSKAQGALQKRGWKECESWEKQRSMWNADFQVAALLNQDVHEVGLSWKGRRLMGPTLPKDLYIANGRKEKEKHSPPMV